MKIIITEEQLDSIICGEVSHILEEIDVSIDGKETMTDTHERLVDTSSDNNPGCTDKVADGIKVWSIFKRKERYPNESDGNPMINTVKRVNDYELTNPKVVKTRIEQIADKFFQDNKGIDVTIMVPSANVLNHYFANVIAKRCKNPECISNVLVKMSTEEVENYIYKPDSIFHKYYKENFWKQYQTFKNYCNEMKGCFQFHKIYDIEMRKVIEHTIKLSNEYYSKYIEALNDKNVILVDDSITLGQSIRESCTIISNYYTPKSISVITLLSPLYNDEGTESKDI